MTGNEWSEIITVKEENRHELVLSGPTVSERIAKHGLDTSLFKLTNLNFLRVSETCLETVPDLISNLHNLTTLVLDSNKINALTSSVGKLSKLKNLDVSRNLLEEFPKEVSDLSVLYSLNISFNKLRSCPSFENNTWLTVLDLSNNCLENFPDICSNKLCHLSEVRLSSNSIKDIPHSISLLPVLKVFDVSDNKVKNVPGELSDISKLKDINLKGNPLADRRLGKMVLQCHSKQVLDYIRQHCKKQTADSKGKKSLQNTSVSENSPSVDETEENDVVNQMINKIEVMHISDASPIVITDKEVKSVRPYIVCCIVKGLNFTADSFKKFIKLQNHLHDNLCNKRQAATLATHDMSAVAPGPLKYVAKPPDQVFLKPLGSSKDTSASVVFSRLCSHAKSVMQDKKRNKYSGIHKFLYLLEGKPLYPFLMDSADTVISFPPLTNSQATKMSVDSKAMLIEVTSSTSLPTCKKVMDTFLLECVQLGINTAQTEGEATGKSLIVEQVKIVDAAGMLQVLYPSRTDLIFEGADMPTIVRN